MQNVPLWSFLAIEPITKSVIRRKTALTHSFVRSNSSGKRAEAFWELLAIAERETMKTAPHLIADRHRFVIQFFYALVDLTELSGASDREIQTRLNAICKREIGHLATHALVQNSVAASVA